MLEVQDIFRECGKEYLERYSPPPHVQKTVRAITECRTAKLGGHVDKCEECGYTRISYNSCRNRHCPKCQGLSKERWIAARQGELLPVTYFHVVFTLPSELYGVAFQNQTMIYNLLFKASNETIRELARDGKYLGAEIGLTAILHTWGQNLTLHPHVHMIVPGGGLTTDGKWVNSRKKFFIPVKVMASKFRGNSADEFIRRFLLHVLPHGFTKIRHYGFLASAVKRVLLVLCKKLTGAKSSVLAVIKLSVAELMLKLTGRDITKCPCCGSNLIRASPTDQNCIA